jgi:hypothetical protein
MILRDLRVWEGSVIGLARDRYKEQRAHVAMDARRSIHRSSGLAAAIVAAAVAIVTTAMGGGGCRTSRRCCEATCLLRPSREALRLLLRCGERALLRRSREAHLLLLRSRKRALLHDASAYSLARFT